MFGIEALAVPCECISEITPGIAQPVILMQKKHHLWRTFSFVFIFSSVCERATAYRWVGVHQATFDFLYRCLRSSHSYSSLTQGGKNHCDKIIHKQIEKNKWTWQIVAHSPPLCQNPTYIYPAVQKSSVNIILFIYAFQTNFEPEGMKWLGWVWLHSLRVRWQRRRGVQDLQRNLWWAMEMLRATLWWPFLVGKVLLSLWIWMRPLAEQRAARTRCTYVPAIYKNT